ncbi:AraC family transcriptional regulator [Enterococcus thailandicus]|uniref:AraC family transcriptional regulator n=1 Tax=Enterococcus thailandicus TaxID=417368 RepID=A0A510WIV9_ENTTH|nr:AraC family transcriptional regulator [Enterococcus thailandicus]MDA3966034.1 AraC family transcriptional regulator [Enterococcus thailandicus]MDT2845457.1 AraC family transcriptional regulator [Enterococcus thailandicus]GEK36670.1 AraC family transcriptional regulator [Enterococcus thailandicus]GMB99743.1 AraC family transcriptional regulator [Enterococcus thailandicus]
MTIYFNLSIRQLPISIESIGTNWQQVSLQRTQGHPLYHWLQTETGAGEIWIEKQKLTLAAGEGVLISPFVPHAYYPLTDDWQTNFVTFDGHLKNHLDLLVGNEQFLLAKDTEKFQFSTQIEKMIAAFEANTDHLALSVLCYQFLLQLSQPQENMQIDELYQKYVLPSLNEIQANYAQHLTIDQIAQKQFITPQYFSRLFKKFMGKSPYQYLIDFRIRQAKNFLINQPDLSIQLVGERVGFDSTSQFINTFKKKTGYTPKNFRKFY